MDLSLQPGDIVAGLEPTEYVEIRSISPFGNRKLIEGIGVNSRKLVKRPLSEVELSQLKKIRGSSFSYDGNANAFLLGVEAERIRIAYQFDPLFAVNSSVVDILPHQVEAVYRYLLPLPRIRFLLADDTGAGKTIMTGLLIKELLFRGVLNKVLIITPGGLTRQWQQDEMQDKFGLYFRLVNRASFEADPGQFSRLDEGFFITSIDFISRHEGCLNAARETQWDMIVVDEAHKLSAYEYISKVNRSARYYVVEQLSPHTDHLLFLTATPHRGRKDTFRRLLMLLDEDLFQKDELVTKRIHDAVAKSTYGETQDEETIVNARNRFFLRRLKEEMVGWDNNQLFKPRHTKTVGYELTPEELELYNAVTKYVRSRRKEAKAKRNRQVELTLMVMQRRLASSIYAITRTLQNRLKALEEVLTILRDSSNTLTERKRLLNQHGNDIPEDLIEYEELDEIQREDVDKRIFRQVLSDDPVEVEKERNEVQELVLLAESLRNHPEAKFSELLQVLDESDVIRREDEKLLIFTEHKDTLNNLSERLTNLGYHVTTIHGGMDVDLRKQKQREFRTRAKIMIATDAAGEGINLQFCRFLINWDIPWNPNRLEQRMGRIHRYGQKDDVWVYNLVAINTREGSVLEKVLKKMDVMREQLGDDRVYDVIDDLLEEVPLYQLLENSIDSETSVNAVSTIESKLGSDLDEKAKDLVALQKKQSLASRLDLREARRLRDTSDERRLQPLFIQRFFMAAFHAIGGTINEDSRFPVYHLGRTPSALMDVARSLHLPISENYDYPIVFDKELVSVASKIRVPEGTHLLGPGHPLFEALIELTIRNARDDFARGVTLVDPNIGQPQKIWLVRSNIDDGRVEVKHRLAHQELCLVVADHLGLRKTSPANMLNFVTPDMHTELPSFSERSIEDIQMWTYENLTEKQLQLVQQQRQIECDLRRSYLETTFTELILELQEKLNDYQQLQLYGDDDPEERHKLEQRIELLKQRKKTRLDELTSMMHLRANLPDIVTSGIVIPSPVAILDEQDALGKQGVPMRRDDEVERIAMEIALRYERQRNWTPVDVSQDGEHYDIRSQSMQGEVRFIEVKGRAESGPIILTAPEIDKLCQLGERAYLYIVTNCKGTIPKLRVIQDPLAKLHPEMIYRQIQFLIQENDWSAFGKEIQQLNGPL